MRYLTKFFPNENLMEVQTDIEIPVESHTKNAIYANITNTVIEEMYESSSFLRDLVLIDGAVEVSVSRYCVRIIRSSSLFAWPDIVAAVIYVLQSHLDPDGEAIEVK